MVVLGSNGLMSCLAHEAHTPYAFLAVRHTQQVSLTYTVATVSPFKILHVCRLYIGQGSIRNDSSLRESITLYPFGQETILLTVLPCTKGVIFHIQHCLLFSNSNSEVGKGGLQLTLLCVVQLLLSGDGSEENVLAFLSIGRETSEFITVSVST